MKNIFSLNKIFFFGRSVFKFQKLYLKNYREPERAKMTGSAKGMEL